MAELLADAIENRKDIPYDIAQMISSAFEDDGYKTLSIPVIEG